MKLQLGSKIKISDIIMIVSEIHMNFGGISYVFSYFANGELKYVQFYEKELNSIEAQKV